MKIAASYYAKTAKGLRCMLCPHYCIIADGQFGKCQTRMNRWGELYAINYGMACSANIDPIEKKPFYHFLPQSKAFSIATAGCNFTCPNCQNHSISQLSQTANESNILMTDNVVSEAIQNNCKSIAYTYTEPTVFYEYMRDTAKRAHRHRLKNVMVSNGYINEAPLRELCKLLDAANIDLKSFSHKTYRKFIGGSLNPVLNTLKVLKDEGVWLEITNLIIPAWTDDLTEIQQMCDWLVDAGMQDCPLHFSRFFPTYKLIDTPPTPIDTLLQAHKIAVKSGLKYVYIGNVPGSALDDTLCPSCKKTLVHRNGYDTSNIYIVEGKCGFCGEKIAGEWS